MARTALPPRRRRALRAIAEAVFSGPAGAPPPARLDWLLDDLDDLFTRSGARARGVSRLMIFAVSVLAPLMVWRPWPFHRLALATRIRALGRLEDSVLSAPILALKAMLCIVWYEHPDSAAAVGFHQTCLEAP